MMMMMKWLWCTLAFVLWNLSNDTHIRVISSMEPFISTKIFKNLRAKNALQIFLRLHLATLNIAHLDYAFSQILELEASPVEGQSLQQKIRIRVNGKAKTIEESEEPKDIAHFRVQNLSWSDKNVITRGASGKKGMGTCCKCFFSGECTIGMVWGVGVTKALWHYGPCSPCDTFLFTTTNIYAKRTCRLLKSTTYQVRDTFHTRSHTNTEHFSLW